MSTIQTSHNRLASPDTVVESGEATLVAVHGDFDHVSIQLVNHPGLLQCQDVRTEHIREIVTIEGEITGIAQPQVAIKEAVYE